MGAENNKAEKIGRAAACAAALLVLFAFALSMIWEGFFPFIDGLFVKTGLKASGDAQEQRIIFPDVGQGDCALIISRGAYILIDCGPQDCSKELADELAGYVSCIDLVIISHPHEDHIGGLAEILSHFEVKQLMIGGMIPEDNDDLSAYQLALSQAEAAGVSISEIPVSLTVGGCILSFFCAGEDILDENARSLVLSAEFEGGARALFCGDCNRERLESLGDKISDCGLIKVPHHGAEDSVSASFYDSVSPEYAVISVGEGNPYGHPAEQLTNLLEDRGIMYRRTDINGTVTFVTDSDGWRVDE